MPELRGHVPHTGLLLVSTSLLSYYNSIRVRVRIIILIYEPFNSVILLHFCSSNRQLALLISFRCCSIITASHIIVFFDLVT